MRGEPISWVCAISLAVHVCRFDRLQGPPLGRHRCSHVSTAVR